MWHDLKSWSSPSPESWIQYFPLYSHLVFIIYCHKASYHKLTVLKWYPFIILHCYRAGELNWVLCSGFHKTVIKGLVKVGSSLQALLGKNLLVSSLRLFVEFISLWYKNWCSHFLAGYQPGNSLSSLKPSTFLYMWVPPSSNQQWHFEPSHTSQPAEESSCEIFLTLLPWPAFLFSARENSLLWRVPVISLS
jgi:hypothetical protein